jgi:hypothetical protein
MTKDEWYIQLFERLNHSKFRSSFHLKQKDIDYIKEKGMDTIRDHARDFIAKREAPAVIPNDGISPKIGALLVLEVCASFHFLNRPIIKARFAGYRYLLVLLAVAPLNSSISRRLFNSLYFNSTGHRKKYNSLNISCEISVSNKFLSIHQHKNKQAGA